MQLTETTRSSAAVYRLDRSVPTSGRTAPARCDAAPLIFVTGASRSGTTMLARMLGAHSAIMTFNELHYFGSLWDPFDSDKAVSEHQLSDLAATLLARETNGLWGGRPTEVERAWGWRLVKGLTEKESTPAGLFAAALCRLAQDAGCTFACEQTPRNIFYARRLLELYPEAHVIHIVRDPRAVLASQKNRWHLRRLGAYHLPVTEMLRNRVNYHPFTMAHLWAKATDAALGLVGHPQFMMLRFEDLAADPEAGARRLCNLLGLRFEPGMLEIPRWGSSNIAHDSEHKGVATEVVDKWRDSLSAGEGLICERITHRLMLRLGYAPEFLGRRGALAALPSLLSYPLHVAGVIAMNPGRAWIQLQAMWRPRRAH
jgi:hypothetical protein